VEAEWGEQAGDHDELRRKIESAIRSRLSVPASVILVPPGSIERSEMKSRLTRLMA
jgi:phenylacetate-CoA ligase